LVEEDTDPVGGDGTPNGDLEQEVAGLYTEHAARLLRYAGTITRNRETGRDAVQEVFLRYFAERRYGSHVENPRAWLYRVLHNYLLDRLDRAAMRYEVSDEGADEVRDACVDAEVWLEQTQTAQEIASRFTPRELDCLRLRVEGLSYQEIAQVLGIRTGTVGALLPRVYAKLRDAAAEGIFLSENTVGAIGLLLRGGQTHSS
jgi:RNA polymerase sigma-70 factor (ECF subfamily)